MLRFILKGRQPMSIYGLISKTVIRKKKTILEGASILGVAEFEIDMKKHKFC